MTKRIWKSDVSLFWFLPEGTELDLSRPAKRDQVVQQVITRGSDRNVIRLLNTLSLAEFEESFRRIQKFTPPLVQKFWEKYIANHHSAATSSARDTV